MKNTGIKIRGILSFGTAAAMLAHLIILLISMAGYSAFPGAAWFQDPTKMFLIGIYGLPIIAVTALTVFSLKSKKVAAKMIFCLVKFSIVLPLDFFVFCLMLLAYHNPTDGQYLLLTISCIAVAVIGLLIMVYEIIIIPYDKFEH